MTPLTEKADLTFSQIEAAAHSALRMIPPLWPLASSVAVNPFLGHTKEPLAAAGARLSRLAGVQVTMPRRWYENRISAGLINDDDLRGALASCPYPEKPIHIEALKAAFGQETKVADKLACVADLAARASGIDWPGFLSDRFGLWAGGYFDQGQALWVSPRGKSPWAAWRAWASHDICPEIQGLKSFASYVADLPDNPVEAIFSFAQRLGLGGMALAGYFHQLLLSLGGWAQYARYFLWRAELEKKPDDTLLHFLAIRLAWEDALHTQYSRDIVSAWQQILKLHAAPFYPDPSQIIDAILQEAAERGTQRTLFKRLSASAPSVGTPRWALQAAFCIDVRSELFRRALEAISPSVQTLGFAGFFGIFTKHRRFASDIDELRLPVLLNPNVHSCSAHMTAGTECPDQTRDLSARHIARAKRAWGRFKMAAVSSFAFVEAMGPVYVAKLMKDSFGIQTKNTTDDPPPRFSPVPDISSRVAMAETVLNAMSLTSGFARVVLLVGHGANVVNNPLASGLHCGACGGYSGDVNARLLALLLNDKLVREGLVERGIVIPADTLFVAALHDTTTDKVTLYAHDNVSPEHASDLSQVRDWLAMAGDAARHERSQRLPRARNASDILARARDWAETRPEWALAGCRAFIAAPRHRTSGRNLEGQAFLHDYDWRLDSARGYPVLELIMTAPVVVASWISLQYYGSTVAPQAFGSGNKLLHNVVGGFGVFEGNGGVLRPGLPWQSVYDGTKLAHEPLRLTVCIEAPIEQMTNILARHEDVRALFDNRWLHLFALDGNGQLAQRYVGDLEWEAVANPDLDDKESCAA